MKDKEEFEELRQASIEEIKALNKKMKHKNGLRKIKKETMKHMIDNGQTSLYHQ